MKNNANRKMVVDKKLLSLTNKLASSIGKKVVDCSTVGDAISRKLIVSRIADSNKTKSESKKDTEIKYMVGNY